MGQTRRWARVPGWLVIALVLLPAWRPAGRRGAPPEMLPAPGVSLAGGEEKETPPIDGLEQNVLPALFQVEGETVRGTGFLIDPAGLVIAGRFLEPPMLFGGGRRKPDRDRYVAVRIDSSRKVAAQILADDPGFNISILRVNPQAVEGITPLPLAPFREDQGPPVSEGDRVWTVCAGIGRPTVAAAGRVIEVRAEKISTDLVPDARHVGCPVLNAQGEVVAFVSRKHALSKIDLFAIHVASEALNEARERAAGSDPPPADLLPVPPGVLYPEAALIVAASRKREAGEYHAQLPTGVTLEFLTPPLIHSLAAEADPQGEPADGREIRYQRGRSFFWWQRHAGRTDPVVTIQAVPPMLKAPGSVAWTTFGWIFALPSCGQSLESVDITYRFKPPFVEMVLLKDGVRVPPVYPGRVCSIFRVRAMKDSRDTDWRDTVSGCYGAYEFTPDVFRTGAHLTLQVFTADRADPDTFDLSPTIIEQIESDFEPFYRATGPAADPSR